MALPFRDILQNDQGVNGNRMLVLFPAIFFMLLCGWIIINLLQAGLTDITEDEAYYWMYSRHMAWGYFDHPPMIALFVKVGTLFFKDELGVRLVPVLAQAALLVVLWIIIGEKSPTRHNVVLFFGIAASVVMFQVFGFVATPDSPLLLFAGLFLLSYQRFLVSESTRHTLFLGLCMAGLMYSKYHGALVIMFVLLSNLQLLTRVNFWLAGIVGILAFIPHIVWQFQFDFPTLQYHLVTRTRPVALKNILNYWPNQMLNFNPVLLGISIFILFRFRPESRFERALYFIIGGFLVFFFLTSLRGHVEPHWTIAASLPMMILLYHRCQAHAGIRRFVRRFLFPLILLLIILRLGLVYDFLPGMSRFHGHKEWCEKLAAISNDKPVVFFNSYQKPSLYTFNTGNQATTLTGVTYKRTQYDLWHFDQNMSGSGVALMTPIKLPSTIPFEYKKGKTEHIYLVDPFVTVQRIHVNFEFKDNSVLVVGDSISLHTEVQNPYPFPVDFKNNTFPVYISACLIRHGRDVTQTPTIVSPDILVIQPGESLPCMIRFAVPDVITGEYNFGISLTAGIVEGAFNSRFIPVEIRSVK